MFLLIGVLSGLSNLDRQKCANTLEATQPHTLSQLRGQQLPSLQGVALDDGVLGNALIQKLGSAFRQWCRSKRIPIPPCTWNLHLVGRGELFFFKSFSVNQKRVDQGHGGVFCFERLRNPSMMDRPRVLL